MDFPNDYDEEEARPEDDFLSEEELDKMSDEELERHAENCTIKVTQNNIDAFVHVFAEERPEVLEEDIYRFFHQKDIFEIEMRFKDLTSKFDLFLGELIDKALLSLIQEGVLEMGYDENLGEPVYWLKNDEKLNKKKNKKNNNKGE